MICSVCASNTWQDATNLDLVRAALDAAVNTDHQHPNPNPCWYGGHGCQGPKLNDAVARAENAQAVAQMATALLGDDKKAQKARKSAERASKRAERLIYAPK